MKRSNQRSLRPLVLAVIVLVVLALQVAPVAADSYLQCTRFSDKLVQGVAETGVPYLDSDDGYFYVVRGAQTGSVTRWLTRTPSSYAVKSGTLLGADSLSNMSYSDDIYWSVKSQAGYGQYNPSSYMLLGSTKLKGGSLSDLTSNNSQYMSFESYSSTEGQYGLKFNYTYYMDAGNGPSLDITGSFTLEFRIKWNTAPPDGETSDIVGKWDGGDGYALWYDYTSGWLTLHGDIARNWVVRGTGTSFSPLTLGTWYHIVFINDNGCRLLYVNGIRKSNESSNPINPGSTSEHLWIGGIPPVHNNWTLNYATLDEVAIWNVVRPEWKGKASFTVPTEPYIGNEANLVGLWHLDEGTGSTAYDSTSNHNDAIAKKRLGSAITTPYWVTGYPFASVAAVDFYGFSNTNSWDRLVWVTDLRFNVSSVFVRVQLYNYTLSGWAIRGSGLFSYNSSSTPNLDEGATRTITVRPQDFRNASTGAWGMRVSCRKYTTKPFALGCDLIEHSPVAPGAEVELNSTVPDVNIRSGLATLNVTLESRCNVSSLVQNLYVFNYTRDSFDFWGTLMTTNTTDNELHINLTTSGIYYVSGAGQMKIKINSTHSGIYVVEVDLVQWDLKYFEPIWEAQWRVDCRTTISKSDITKLSVRLKGNLSRTAEIACLSMYNYSAACWTQVIQDANHTSVQTQWYNTTIPLDINRFIRSDGILNVTMHAFETNWTTIKSYTDHLVIYIHHLTPDTSPPAPINDLVAVNPTLDSVTLTWIATGDDGNTGAATAYAVKYSTAGPISASSWDSATTFIQSWVPLVNGSVEIHTVSGLQPDTQYWFAIKAIDETPNYSGVSNCPYALTRDNTPPSTITDLVASNPAVDSITLTWTSPGDNGYDGTATGYLIKYSPSGLITNESWESSATYAQSWVPVAAGGNETHAVYGLNSSTQYWFAIKAYDEAYNYGGVSNSVDATTSSPQQVGGGSLGSLLLVIIPVSLIAVTGVGVVGLKVMGRSRQVGPKSPFRKRSKTLEGVARPKLREYVGESGVVPQPKKRAKFEEQSSNEGKERSG